MKLQYVEQKEANGTAKAIQLSENFFDDDFIVCSADVIVPEKCLEELIAKKKLMLFCLCGKKIRKGLG